MITRIVPSAIDVQDLQATENFFRTVFEMDVHERTHIPEGDGMVSHLGCRDSSVKLKLLKLTAPSDSDETQRAPSPETRRLTVFSNDLTGDMDRFVANGATVLETPSGSTSRATYASFAGPEGYTIEMIAYRPADKKLRESGE